MKKGGDTICALATPPGEGAIAMVRISGPEALTIASDIFRTRSGKKKDFHLEDSHTAHFGTIQDDDQVLDEVVLTIFKKPHSYTTEDIVEISCHGSIYIQQKLLQLIYKKGARPAEQGEFTLRAFLNGRLDLSQAEAVADLIATRDAAMHKVAMEQLRGGFSHEIKQLREELIRFASLVELELDFSEEDVEFANRSELRNLVAALKSKVHALLSSFDTGSALKTGIPVVIAGKPNVGKSTLLNALLNEEKAIVSDIAGTTRDVIEDELVIEGIRFRFLDTAGIRHTEDTIEKIGVERTMQQIEKAHVIIYIEDGTSVEPAALTAEQAAMASQLREGQYLITVINKEDLLDENDKSLFENVIFISARNKTGLDALKTALLEKVKFSLHTGNETLVINARHAAALSHSEKELEGILNGIGNHLPSDLLAFHIRQALQHLSEITGDIYTEDLLEHIFSRFCIGK